MTDLEKLLQAIAKREKLNQEEAKVLLEACEWHQHEPASALLHLENRGITVSFDSVYTICEELTW